MDQEPDSAGSGSPPVAAATAASQHPLLRWLDRFPLPLLAALALWLAVAPIVPQPHLVEKLRMLLAGTLTRPLDLFDLLWHSVPLVLLALRLWRRFVRRR